MASGPLSHLKIVEFAGIGPGPFCCMLLSDMGAEIVRIDRKANTTKHFRAPQFDVASRGRRSVTLDLKNKEAVETALKLVEQADAIVEGFRPGVMERLGLGPDVMLARNPKLVYGRMTGWGQTGTAAQMGGHDINYVALTGALAAIGPRERPVMPINLVGDYGGGALYLAMGLLAALSHARETGRGQVVDCAISDGAASLMAVCYGSYAAGTWTLDREENLLDGGRASYGIYECADGKFVTLGSSEPHFYRNLRELMQLDDPEFDHRDRAHWASLKAKLTVKFKTKTRQEWCDLLEGGDCCFAPVLDMSEAPSHPHNKSRDIFVEVDGVIQPAPAPRFSVTPGEIQGIAPEIGQHTEQALLDWGIGKEEIERLRVNGAL